VTFRTATLAALALTALAVAAYADKDEKKDKEKAKVYKTPEDVFDAFTKAGDKDDWKTVAALLAPQAQKDAAATIAVIFGADRPMLEESDDEKVKQLLKAFKPIYDAMDKHGVTTKVLKEVKKSKDPKEVEKSKKAVTAVIKDPEAFFVDVMTAFTKLGFGGEKPETKEELKDLKIDGDKAKGTVVRTTKFKGQKDKVKKEPVEFVKINDSWRIIPTFDLGDDDEAPKDKDEKKDK